jgi:hypothetical protein
MKRQAAYHGEIGANGKAYTKGQFIAEQPEYLGTATKARKGLGKQEIEPYVWEIPESPEMKSIYRFIPQENSKPDRTLPARRSLVLPQSRSLHLSSSTIIQLFPAFKSGVLF